ncbi:trichohyalin, partial [Scomber scombrus]
MDLQREVCRLQEQLADSRAEREELESRNRVLSERLCQSVSPSLALSLRVEGEQREWRRKVREGREREARQALLIHRLQKKVLEYRDRCQHLDLHLQDEKSKLLNTELRIRDEHNDSLESALIRLEEEQQRSVCLADTNSALREQLSQSEQANQALREDLLKLTADWTREKECRTGSVCQQQDRLLSVWSCVVALRRHCHTVKTATDRDLWQLRAEFSRLSSSLLSSCDVVSSSLRIRSPPIRTSPSELPPSLSPPLTSSSTLGTFSLEELQHKEEREISELKILHETEVSQLKERIAELSRSLQAEESEHEERERAIERHKETERNLQSVSQAVIKLSRVLSSSSGGEALCVPADLSSLLSVLSHTESALQWRHQELQGAELSVQRLNEEKSSLQLRLEHTHTELTHTLDLLRSEREEASFLRPQVEEVQRERDRQEEEVKKREEEVKKREEEVKRSEEEVQRERDRQEERNKQLQTETHRRVETKLLENEQLTERETVHLQELHSLKGALEREQLDRQRAEEEAADARDALQK